MAPSGRDTARSPLWLSRAEAAVVLLVATANSAPQSKFSGQSPTLASNSASLAAPTHRQALHHSHGQSQCQPWLSPASACRQITREIDRRQYHIMMTAADSERRHQCSSDLTTEYCICDRASDVTRVIGDE